MGRSDIARSGKSGQLVALSCRCSLLSSLSNDLAPSARSLFITAIDRERAKTDLERRRFIDAGTLAVESPFLLHLAGTSDWQRLSILSLGFGIVIASAVILLLRRRHFSPTRACLAGLITAYLANAALCLVVYSEATGSIGSRSGWLVSMVIVWPIVFEHIWLFIQTFRARESQIDPRTA